MPLQHPATAFVSTEDVDNMERVVDSAHAAPHRSPFQQNQSHSISCTNLDYESGMHVPTAVLDECNNSFTAADSNRIKANTQFFADTGLIALLCHHDCVLWLVNMTSAGEKQHYVLCLLENLFQNIPLTMRIGFLYDIACQFHQWPCQIVYHLHKCPGFGLSDGESCEIFWSSIKLLIPSLRVSGYYNRIYTLDTQVKHLDLKSLLDWPLFAKGVTSDYLRGQWLQQIAEQTKPLRSNQRIWQTRKLKLSSLY